ncbi:universal stress protein [Streptomyces pactum]|uniref:Universal stress protein n=1 Tax=Streptomyces pactum TaxID=68249 RepID=A0ABS0NT33_9ACTN|nr:universal stress protein [Streptomyces pactum]MBH5338348.1 universal stress protein [Streptomyces pactum]
MNGTVTAGIDGTAPASAAADWAARHAAREGMRLHLVHAPAHGPLDDLGAAGPEARRRWALGVLREARDRVLAAHPGLPVGTELLSGAPVPALTAAAAESELLVVGSRGYGALRAHLLGSVSLGVLRHTDRPVVVTRTPLAAAAPDRPEEVVVGIDATSAGPEPGMDRVLDFAFARAAARGATLCVVHAWPAPTTLVWSPGGLRPAEDVAEAREAQPRYARMLCEALRPWRARYPGVAVVEHVRSGAASEVLTARADGAGQVVVGRRGHGAGPRRIGAVTHAVLHHVPGAVAVVPV